jgi:putative FmdB family regulatory protein
MPTYRYRCAECGTFDLLRRMSERAEHEPCPGCGSPAVRVFTAPALHSVDAALGAALTASERSADSPAVVTAVPASRRRTPVTTDPRHLSLPRP